MRRKDKEISDQSGIRAIIEKADICRLGMISGTKPYIVPLCFGYKDDLLYFHGSLKGHKIDLIRKNPNVCFEFDLITEKIKSENACDWGMKYQSVIGFGRASLIESPDEKRKALSIIISHYSNRQFNFPETRLKETAVIKVEIESMTGKHSGFSKNMDSAV